jgi:hypothetical protein
VTQTAEYADQAIQRLHESLGTGPFAETPAPPRLPSTATRRHHLFQALKLLAEVEREIATLDDLRASDELSELFARLDELMAEAEENA